MQDTLSHSFRLGWGSIILLKLTASPPDFIGQEVALTLKLVNCDKMFWDAKFVYAFVSIEYQDNQYVRCIKNIYILPE